jgi:hypothetical protein
MSKPPLLNFHLFTHRPHPFNRFETATIKSIWPFLFQFITSVFDIRLSFRIAERTFSLSIFNFHSPIQALSSNLRKTTIKSIPTFVFQSASWPFRRKVDDNSGENDHHWKIEIANRNGFGTVFVTSFCWRRLHSRSGSLKKVFFLSAKSPALSNLLSEIS